MPKAETATEKAAATATTSRWQTPYQRKPLPKNSASITTNNQIHSPAQLLLTSTPSIATTALSPSSPSFSSSPQLPPKASFLGVPAEIRENIYCHLRILPAAQSTAEEKSEREAMKIARKSLRLVFRKLGEEWSPIFHSTTTMMATAIKGPGQSTKERRLLAGKDCKLPSVVFEALVLGARQFHMLKRITKLEYKLHEGNGDDLTFFSKNLGRHMVKLESLEEVVLSLAAPSHRQYTLRVSDSRIKWGRTFNDVLWAHACRHQCYNISGLVRNKFNFRKGGMPLRGWNTLRRLRYETQSGSTTCDVHEIHMVFRKRLATRPPLSDGWIELAWR